MYNRQIGDNFMFLPIFFRPSVKVKSGNSSSNNNNNACSKNKNLSTTASSSNSNSRSTSTSTTFTKGTIIELSNGELKRVEDMRTEDFITASSKTPNLQIIDTTVVKMTLKSKNNVLITLSHNNNKVN